MRNYQSQSQIYYNTRVKEREIRFFEKREIFVKNFAEERGGA